MFLSMNVVPVCLDTGKLNRYICIVIYINFDEIVSEIKYNNYK